MKNSLHYDNIKENKGNTAMYHRFLDKKIEQTQLPVVFINGARQVGKSTLVKKIFSHTHDYLTLDDPQTLALAKQNPLSFIRYAQNPLIIDEIQRCPDLLLAIKTVVDEKRTPRQFILTGSVNILHLAGVKDSLAGRMVVFTLWPLSQEEINCGESSFLENLFKKKIVKPRNTPCDLIECIKRGGYPLAVDVTDSSHRNEWLNAYLTQILEKDIRDLSNIEGLRELPNILGLLASRTGSLLNASELSRSLQISYTTLKRYLSLLEMTYLFCPLQPWFRNMGKRLVKSEKTFLIDTALIETILHRDINADPLLFGHIFENFIAMELTKQLSYKTVPAKLFHYRSVTGEEVDFILETTDGSIVGIEVKSTSHFSHKDTKGLRLLKDELKDQFKMGIVLYQGENVLPIDENIYAVPAHYMWT